MVEVIFLQIKTSLDPNGLLKRLKHVEDKLGRRRTVDKGPRCIDLDILLYDSLRLNATDLVIPHELMMEREFVLRPLCE